MLCNHTFVHQEADNTVNNYYLFSILQNAGILCSILLQIINPPRTPEVIQLSDWACVLRIKRLQIWFLTLDVPEALKDEAVVSDSPAMWPSTPAHPLAPVWYRLPRLLLASPGEQNNYVLHECNVFFFLCYIIVVTEKWGKKTLTIFILNWFIFKYNTVHHLINSGLPVYFDLVNKRTELFFRKSANKQYSGGSDRSVIHHRIHSHFVTVYCLCAHYWGMKQYQEQTYRESMQTPVYMKTIPLQESNLKPSQEGFHQPPHQSTVSVWFEQG